MDSGDWHWSGKLCAQPCGIVSDSNAAMPTYHCITWQSCLQGKFCKAGRLNNPAGRQRCGISYAEIDDREGSLAAWKRGGCHLGARAAIARLLCPAGAPDVGAQAVRCQTCSIRWSPRRPADGNDISVLFLPHGPCNAKSSGLGAPMGHLVGMHQRIVAGTGTG